MAGAAGVAAEFLDMIGAEDQGERVAFMNEGNWGKSFIGSLTDIAIPGICAKDAPDVLRKWVGALKDVPKGQVMQAAFGYHKFGKYTTIPDWFAAAFGLKVTESEGRKRVVGINIFNRFVLAFVQWPLWFVDKFDQILIPSECRGPRVLQLYAARFVYAFIARWLGELAQPSQRQWEAATNFTCPNQWPSPDVVVGAYVTGLIPDLKEAHGWCAMSGWCDTYTDLAIAQRRYRLGIGEIINLKRRGKIDNEKTQELLRAAGVLDKDTRDKLVQGSHTLWSVGEIYRALHELREGRVSPNLVYTEAMARDDLCALGYATDRIDRMIYLAKASISHRQLLMPYKTGAIDDGQIKDYMRDDGYIARDIDRLIGMYRQERKAYLSELTGAPGPKELVAQAAAGTITAEVFDSQLELHGLTQLERERAGLQAAAKRQEDLRAAGIAAVKSGMRSAELTEPQAAILLGQYGIPADTAQNVIGQWRAENDVRTKPAGIGELCTWATRGLMSVKEYRDRLHVLGYAPKDIDRIVSVCDLKDRQAKEKLLQAADQRKQREAAKAHTAEGRIKKQAARLHAAAKKVAKASGTLHKVKPLHEIEAELHAADKAARDVATREREAQAGKLADRPGPAASEIAQTPVPPA